MKYNNNFLTEYFNRIQRDDIDLINTIEYYVKEEEEYFGDEDEEYDEDLLEKYNLYDIECKDTNYEIIFSEDNMTIEEIENVLGPNLAQKIANREGYTEDNESYYLTDLLYSISVDDNNVDDVNAVAKRLFSTCDTYYKDCRGYILTDGTILDFGPNTDHISIGSVGNQRIASFLQLGNIRIGVQSIELACEPTFEQKRQLRRMINYYSDEELYVDIVQDKGYQYGQPLTSAKYINPSFDKVYGEISRFFDEGIKLNGGYCSDDLCEHISNLNNIYNKKGNMKQRIHLTEGQLNKIIKESVKNILKEIGDTPKGQFALGAVRGRALARPMYQNDKYNGVYSRAKQHQIAGQAADKSWENSKDLDINKRKEMTDSEGRGYYYGFKKGMNENVKNKIPNPMGGPEDRINAYPEYAQDWYSEEPMFSIPNKHRLHTLDRTTDSYGDWYRDDHAYYDDGDLYPSAEWCDSYRSPSKDYRWLDDADKELEKMQHKRIKNDLDNKWKTQQDRNKYNKQADSRPLHRKGSLNREL